jgi:endonuclease/exonuclease/phosphatase family metal-dependent hydrolase
VTHVDVCVVHLRVPRDAASKAKQLEQNRALLRWSMRHLAQNPQANVLIMGDFNEGRHVGSAEQSLAVLFQARPPMVDSFSFLQGRARTHHDGRAYDRILVSEGISRGLSGLKLDHVRIIEHRHGKDNRRLYTDHFPVIVTLAETTQRR